MHNAQRKIKTKDRNVRCQLIDREGNSYRTKKYLSLWTHIEKSPPESGNR